MWIHCYFTVRFDLTGVASAAIRSYAPYAIGSSLLHSVEPDGSGQILACSGGKGWSPIVQDCFMVAENVSLVAETGLLAAEA